MLFVAYAMLLSAEGELEVKILGLVIITLPIVYIFRIASSILHKIEHPEIVCHYGTCSEQFEWEEVVDEFSQAKMRLKCNAPFICSECRSDLDSTSNNESEGLFWVHCPICGGFLEHIYNRVSYPLTCRRVECNKCGTAFRGVNLEERFRLIRKGKTIQEREEIAFHT